MDPLKNRMPKPPRNRRESREAAFQVLYAMEFNRLDRHATVSGLARFLPGADEDTVLDQDEFSSGLLDLAERYTGSVEKALRAALRGWDYERLAPNDRVVLRLGVAELLFCEEIPPKVTINEYIEIAREYGDDESPKFVNGVLDRVRFRCTR